MWGTASLRDSVAAALLRQMAAQGVERIFLNPGTDTAPLQAAVVELASLGEQVPEIVTCPHETVALAAAHGYFAATGRPQVVMVHVDVGTQNLGSMVHNAARAYAGVVVLAGKTPLMSRPGVHGGRDAVVHWQQDVPDQAGIVRSYAKLTGDLVEPELAAQQLARALQVAATAPAGLVYLTAAREVLLAPAATAPLPVPAAPAAAAPDPAAVAAAAELLARARRPVIVTARAGTDPAAVPELVRVAERLGATVVDARDRVNFPSSHPLYTHRTADARAALGAADAVLVVDAPVPWIPAVAAPPSDATVVTLDVDPLRISMPGWDFGSTLSIQAEPRLGLRALADALGESAPQGRETPPADGAPGETPADGSPLTAAELGGILGELLRPEDLVVEEATTNWEAFRTTFPRDLPGTFFRSGGSGLGWGLGAAMGVRLAAGAARPDGPRVVCVVGDGAFVFGSPVAALSAMRLAQAPCLVVVLVNGGYAASRAPVFQLLPDSVASKTRDIPGTLFGNDGLEPDYALLATACHAAGIRAGGREDVRDAIRAGLAEVEAGRTAVVTVPVASPWI